MEIARAAGLTDGAKVEVETQDGDIVVRRREAGAPARQDAQVVLRGQGPPVETCATAR
jgi:formylmethanofuran dehydrogenase subunit D